MPKKATIAGLTAQGYVEPLTDEPIDDRAEFWRFVIDDQAEFWRFVRETIGLPWSACLVVYDALMDDGWRQITLHVVVEYGVDFYSDIYLTPPQVDRFPHHLDIPF